MWLRKTVIKCTVRQLVNYIKNLFKFIPVRTV